MGTDGNENRIKIIQQGFATLKQTIVESMSIKPERHHFDLAETPQIVRFMNVTGG